MLNLLCDIDLSRAQTTQNYKISVVGVFLLSIKIESQNRFYQVAYLERLKLISSVPLIAFRAEIIQTSFLNSYDVNFKICRI